MIKKIFAFTLSEILIALSVIGVVAVLVMPQLVAGSKAGKAKAQFNTAYTLMAKAITDMDADDVSIDPNKYPTRTLSRCPYSGLHHVSLDSLPPHTRTASRSLYPFLFRL